MLGSYTYASQDHGIDQSVPVNIIGQEYVAVEGSGVDSTEFCFVIGTQDNTDININACIKKAKI